MFVSIRLNSNHLQLSGLFDFSAEPEFIGKEIVKCINMAKDGIHALLVVLSVRSRFSREEAAAVESLRKFFGSKISDYMVVVFTGGDDLEENEESLDDYLGRDCPEPLRVIRLLNELTRFLILRSFVLWFMVSDLDAGNSQNVRE